MDECGHNKQALQDRTVQRGTPKLFKKRLLQARAGPQEPIGSTPPRMPSTCGARFRRRRMMVLKGTSDLTLSSHSCVGRNLTQYM